MSDEPLVLKTERARVLLRQFTLDDAVPLFVLIEANRAHLSKWGDITANKYIDFKAVYQSIHNPLDPKRLRLGIWARDELVGTINLQPLPKAGYAEVGYWLGEEFEGCGYMSCALRALIRYAFVPERFSHLTANVRVENVRSQKVLERAGFQRISNAYEYLNYRLSEPPL